MQTEPVHIVERGRGPQLSTSRITVQDLVPYIQQKYSQEQIREIMPALTAKEIEVVERYIQHNYDAVMEQDRRIRERAAARRQLPEAEEAERTERLIRLENARRQIRKSKHDLRRLWKWIALVAVGACVVAGYVSNHMTKAECQFDVAETTYRYVWGRSFFLEADEDDEGIRRALDPLKAQYISKSRLGQDDFPRVLIRAHGSMPFFISVDHQWEREALIGGGGTTWFLTFFGYCVKLGDSHEFAT